MDAFSELKGLADTGDSIISKGKSHGNRLAEWFDLVKQAAIAIVNNDVISAAATSNLESQTKLPDIVSFITKEEKVVKKKQRISSALAHMQKDHILHVKRNSRHITLKDLPCETGNKYPEQEESVFNGTFVKNTTCDNKFETPDNDTRGGTSVNTLNGDDKQEFFTPIRQQSKSSQLHTQTVVKSRRSSRKRKSSSPLESKTVSIKKPKIQHSETVSIQKKSLRKSLKGLHGKVSESKLHKYHNRLPSTKISVSGANSSVLKENRGLRMKTESDDGNQTLQKVMAARQIKAQEAKRKREEKMQKTSQQRLKLEKEKDERLRTRKAREVEKPLLKTVLDNKKRVRETEKNHNSEVKSDPPSTKRTRANNTSTPRRTPRTRDAKNVEKENKIEKSQETERNHNTEVTNQTSFEKTKANNIGTPIKTPRKKVTKNLEEETKKEKEEMNKTYLAKPSSSDLKETYSKDPKEITQAKAEVFKTPTPIQRPILSSTTQNASAKVTKSNVELATPLAVKQKQAKDSTLPTSYEMTPARSSYVNYDISEIRSDDSDDDEDTKKNQKPIPGWASGVRLRNALVQQQYHSIDTDLVFGNVFDTPDLVEIMGVKSKRYFKRTSSAIWNSPSAFI